MRRLVPIICLLAVVPLLAQDNKDDIIKSLLARMEALEREVASLKSGASIITTPPLKPVEPATAVQIKIPEVETEPRDDPRFVFHGYADAGFERNREFRQTVRTRRTGSFHDNSNRTQAQRSGGNRV